MRSAKTSVVVVLVALIGLAAVASPFVHGPYSGAPSADSITIGWQAEAPIPARVEYGLRDEFEGAGTLPNVVLVPVPSEEASDTTHVVLAGLSPHSEYAYRVVLEGAGGEIRSDVGFFRTAPEPGTPVSFAVLADTQWQTEETNPLKTVADAITADPTPFDFILHGGDVIESPSSYYWDHWFDSFDDMLRRAPLLPVLGNHEKNHRSYYETFALPPGEGKNGEQWWALHWGDVVVVGLDSNVSKASDFTAQQDWARAHLSGAEPHKFVIFHHPTFGEGEYFFDKIYHPIFVETGVDVVFNGHSHHYEHVVRDGVTYLVVGGGGATPRETRPEHIQGSDISIEGHFFYTRVETTPGRIRVKTISVAESISEEEFVLTGTVLDAFSLPKPEFSIPLRAVAAIAIGLATAVWLFLRALGN